MDRRIQQHGRQIPKGQPAPTGRLAIKSPSAARKTEFADHVWQDGTPEYFTHFEGLHAVVSGILRASS